MDPLAFYAQQKARMKSSRSYMERRSGASCFLYVATRVLKVLKVERYVDREPLTFHTWRCAC
jgi:hypothetical protein